MPSKALEKYGGADVAYDSENFGSEAIHYVSLKGFCVVSTPFDNAVLTDAEREAQAVTHYEAPPALVIEGLLGTEGSAEVAELEVPSLDASERLDAEPLQELDRFFSDVAVQIDDFLLPNLGFNCGERTVGFLNLANKFGSDEPSELTEAKAAKWIHIFRRHRLMLVLCLATKGGSLTLRPFDDESEPDVVSMKFGQLVILRADALAHTYVPAGERDVILTCWLLAPNRAGPRGTFADGRDGIPMVPAADNLIEWSNQRLMLMKERQNEDQGSLHDQDIPRNWKLLASHTWRRGIQCAIRGMALNQPNRVESGPAYVGPLMQGIDYATDIPFRRWDHYHDGPNLSGFYDPEPDVWRHSRWKTNIKHATFIEGHDLFDNKFFNMSVLEGKVMDPNQRLALESAYEALHMAGHTKKSLMQAFIGVYQGHTASDWDKIEHEQAGGCAGSYSPTIASNRVSFALGIMGPSFTIDVEGAASLSAIYQGAHDIIPCADWRKPPTTASVCGGVTLNLSTYWWPVHNQFMSIVGRCLSFDQNAGGYIKGEGVSTSVLKRHGDIVNGEVVEDTTTPNLGIIAGWTMINSGANAGLSAPSGPAIQKVVADSVRTAYVSPLDVDAVECHGAGSYIFDATEVSSVAKVLRAVPGGDEEILAISSTKSKIGFLQESAGIASFFAALVTQRMGCVSPNVHLKALNPYIVLDECAANVGNEITSFRTRASYTSVNAYGFGGTNVNTLIWAEIDVDKFPVPSCSLDRQVFTFWPGGGGQLEDEWQASRGYYIVGSWAQWESPAKMKSEDDGSHSFTVTLGPNRFEHFQIWIDGDSEKVLHPGQPSATAGLQVFGPAPLEESQGLHWAIDGRTQLVALPAVPGLAFTANSGSLAEGGDILEKTMTLEEAKAMCATLPQCRGFHYQGDADATGPVNVVFKSKWDFTEKAGWTSYSVMEQLSSDTQALEYYQVGSRDVGQPGDQYKVSLRIAGKWKTVAWDRMESSETRSAMVDSGDYYVMASWSDWDLQKMERVAATPGLFSLDVTLPGSRFSRQVRGEFQIVRNRDMQQVFFPADVIAASGKSDGTAGPEEGADLTWHLDGEPGSVFRIEFQRIVKGEDDDKKLSWRLIRELTAG